MYSELLNTERRTYQPSAQTPAKLSVSSEKRPGGDLQGFTRYGSIHLSQSHFLSSPSSFYPSSTLVLFQYARYTLVSGFLHLLYPLLKTAQLIPFRSSTKCHLPNKIFSLSPCLKLQHPLLTLPISVLFFLPYHF